MSKKSKGYVKTKERYEKIKKIKTLSEYADMAIFIVSAFLSFVSLSEALKSIFGTGRWVKDQVGTVKEIVKHTKTAAKESSHVVTRTTAIATTAQVVTKTTGKSSKVATATATATTGTKTADNNENRKKEEAISTQRTKRPASKTKSSARRK